MPCCPRRCGCCRTWCGCCAAWPPTGPCRGVRIRLGLLLAYLAIPIDVIPDFIPVLGYADDAIIVTLVLRSTVRQAGLDAVRARWPGTDDGFAALCRLTGLTQSAAPPGLPRIDSSDPDNRS